MSGELLQRRGEQRRRVARSSKEVASGKDKRSGGEEASGEQQGLPEWRQRGERRGRPEWRQRGERRGQPELRGSEEASEDQRGEEARSQSAVANGAASTPIEVRQTAPPGCRFAPVCRPATPPCSRKSSISACTGHRGGQVGQTVRRLARNGTTPPCRHSPPMRLGTPAPGWIRACRSVPGPGLEEAQKRAASICGHKTQTRMASRECDVCDECSNIWGISESLWNQLDHEELPSFLDDDGGYVEMWQNKTELERSDLECSNVSESLWNQPDHEQWPSFPDDGGDYVEMWQNKTELEREEHARALFLEEFPAQRKEIEKCIRSLWEMADAIDKTHKHCTVASLAANSTSASSGILTILGLTLAPFTAGGSLILTAGGLGLGAVAAAAGLSASIYESVSTSKETRKAEELVHECGRSLQMAMRPDEAEISSTLPTNNDAVEEKVKNLVFTVAPKVTIAYKNVKGMKTNVKALKYVQANTGLKSLANRAAEAGRTFWGKVWGGKPVEKAFSGTTLAMGKGARLLGAATAGAFVLVDAYNITQDAKHLSEGAQAETAAEIRDKARKLETELQELNKLYEELKIKVNKSE